ncbi:hypothetical protein RB600_007142 [Gaeumannomyces tritici]
MSDIKIKPERGDDDEEPFIEGDEAAEDDPLEEGGDLEFYDKAADDPKYDNMYLARVPNYVWEAWDKLPDDAEIEVGRIRQWYEVDPKTNQPTPRLRMLLHSNLAQHQLVPKEYDLKVTEMRVNNTFIFSEQDLPHYKEKNRARAEAAAAGVPAKLLRQPRPDKPAERPKFPGGRRRGPRRPTFKKSIPKKTKIAGRVRHELNCIPVDNPETDHMLALRAIEASKPTATVTFIDETNISLNSLERGGLAAQNRLQNFIPAAAQVPAPTKAKRVDMKTTRMAENELLDQIFICFAKHTYWPMKTLRHTLRQPEAYLRQTLEKVAELHRTGRFANTWSLTKDVARSKNISAQNGDDVMAPVVEDADADDDDEEGDVKMEDVL